MADFKEISPWGNEFCYLPSSYVDHFLTLTFWLVFDVALIFFDVVLIFYANYVSTAGSCITSDTAVIRDIFYDGNPIKEKASIILRIAPTFIR